MSWNTQAPPGRFRGLAFCEAFRTLIAQVVEVSVQEDALKVHRVTSVVDAGIVLDPGNSTSQIEGGVAWGLSAALKSEITFEHGRVVQLSNRSILESGSRASQWAGARADLLLRAQGPTELSSC